MGVFIRKDSPFYWLHLERKRKRGKKESTRVLVSTGSKEADEANRLEAQKIYVRRMNELARDDSRRDGHRPTQVGKSGSWCYIYFVRQGDAIKIGRAVNIKNRISSLASGALAPLELLLAVPAHASVEAALHRKFKADRINGEWYRSTAALMELIDQVRGGVDIATFVFELRPKTFTEHTRGTFKEAFSRKMLDNPLV